MIQHDVLRLPELSLANSFNITKTISNEPSVRRLYENQVSHYVDIDKHITRLPQFQDSKEFLSCLAQLTNTETNNFSEINLDSLSSSADYKYEVILENQRGAMVFGIPLFSTESLLYPLDPSKYQTLKGNQITRLDLYPLPGINWKWSWPTWYVLMINDVDEQGWIYSHFRFGSKRWKGRGGFGNFVRRRIWIRMREIDLKVKENETKKEEEELLFDGIPSELFLNTLGPNSNPSVAPDKNKESFKESKKKEKHRSSFNIKNMKKMKRILTPRLTQKHKTHVDETLVADIPSINLIPDQNVSGPSDTNANINNDEHTQFLDEMMSKNAQSLHTTVCPDDATSSLMSRYFLLDIMEKFQSIIDKSSHLPIDRLRVKFLVDSCISMNEEELLVLKDNNALDFNGTSHVDTLSMSSYAKDWIPLFLNTLKFSQSKKIFITKLRNEIQRIKLQPSADYRDPNSLTLLDDLVRRFDEVCNDR